MTISIHPTVSCTQFPIQMLQTWRPVNRQVKAHCERQMQRDVIANALNGGHGFRTYLSLTSHNGTWKDVTRMGLPEPPPGRPAPPLSTLPPPEHSPRDNHPLPAHSSRPSLPVPTYYSTAPCLERHSNMTSPPKTPNHGRLNLYDLAPTLPAYPGIGRPAGGGGARGLASPENTKEIGATQECIVLPASRNLVQVGEFLRYPDHQRSQMTVGNGGRQWADRRQKRARASFGIM